MIGDRTLLGHLFTTGGASGHPSHHIVSQLYIEWFECTQITYGLRDNNLATAMHRIIFQYV